MPKFNPPNLSHDRPRKQQPRVTVPNSKATGTHKQVGKKPYSQRTPWEREQSK